METIEKLFASISKLDIREIDSSFLEMIERDCEAFSQQLNPLIVSTLEADHLKIKGLFPPGVGHATSVIVSRIVRLAFQVSGSL